MFGLIIKDFKNVFGMMIYYLILLALFLTITLLSDNIYFYIGAVVFFTISVPLSALAYDEKDNWDKFALAAGVSRKQLAVSRYLLALAVLFPLWLISFLLLLAEDLRSYENLSVVLMYGGISLLSTEIVLPLVFRIGTEKARLLYIIVILAVLVLGGLFAAWVETIGGMSVLIASLCILAVGIVGFFISMKISCSIYRHKDF